MQASPASRTPSGSASAIEPPPQRSWPVNVAVSAEDEQRIQEVDRAWTGPRLILLLLVTLALAVAALYGLASL